MTLSIVAPVWNEEAHIAEFIDRSLSAAKECSVTSYELILVNDGSWDATEEIIRDKIQQNPGLVKLVDLARNFGQQAAYHAGLSIATGGLVVTIDSDLQDPPEVIPDLIKKIQEGFDIVYAKRVVEGGGQFGASGHTGLKSVGAFLFHSVMSRFKYHSIPRDVGEYRCMTQQVVRHLVRFPEYNVFFPGLVAYLGFNVGFIEYVRARRTNRAPTTTMNLVMRALDALTTFSIIPIKGIMVLSFAVWLLPLGMVGWILINAIAFDQGFSLVALAWVSMALAWCINLTILAVIAHYLGRIFFEVKRRPRYFVKRTVEIDGE